jgi:[ribosomal protein S18]-alanine N-acetyltransferase
VPSLRPVETNDVSQVQDIETACFPDPWDPHIFEALAAGNGQVQTQRGNTMSMYVAGEGDEVVGYVVWEEKRRSIEGRILNLAVEPKHRGKGLGKSLLLHAFGLMKMHGMRSCRLETWESNWTARHLYENVGMVATGRHPSYYGKEDAILYSVRLD